MIDAIDRDNADPPDKWNPAETYERMGDARNARQMYRRFIDLWQPAGSNEYVESARVRLARLST
ncbi:MAG: hypothetical protein ACT4O1_13570 [Gemmatimonadota bacterium]